MVSPKCIPRKHFPRALTLVAWLVTAAPLVVLLIAVHRYYLPFPWGESYVMFPPLLQKWYEGGLTLSDFYVVQNDYVVLFPAMIHFVLAALSGWNQAWEVGLNVLLGIGLFGVYLSALRRSCNEADTPFPHALVPAVALLTFSLNQSCNWMWGSQIMTFLSMFCATAAILVLSHPRTNLWRLSAAILLSLVSTFSFGTGLLVWPAGFFALALGPWASRRRRVSALVIWCLAGMAALGVFLLSVRRGASIGALASPERLWLALRFVPIFLSAGLVKFHLAWLAVAGYGLIAAGFIALAGLWRTPRVPLSALIPCITMMLYSAGLGFVAVFNSGTETPSLDDYAYGTLMEGAILRYPTMAIPYQVGLVIFLWLGYWAFPRATWCHRMIRAASLAGITALCLGSALSARTGYYEAQERYALYAPQAQRLVVQDMDYLPTRLQWPYGNRAEEAVRLMKRHSLSVFREESHSFWFKTDGTSNWD